MISIARVSALLLSLALAHPLLAQSQAVKIVGLVELSGTGTTSGTNFNPGILMDVTFDTNGDLDRESFLDSPSRVARPGVMPEITPALRQAIAATF